MSSVFSLIVHVSAVFERLLTVTIVLITMISGYLQSQVNNVRSKCKSVAAYLMKQFTNHVIACKDLKIPCQFSDKLKYRHREDPGARLKL